MMDTWRHVAGGTVLLADSRGQSPGLPPAQRAFERGRIDSGTAPRAASLRAQPGLSFSKQGTVSGSAANERGTALFIVLGVLAVLMISSSAFIGRLHQAMTQSRQDEAYQTCLQLAEGGIDKAIAELRTSRGAYQGEPACRIGEGCVALAVRSPGEAGVYSITAKAAESTESTVRTHARIEAEVLLAGDGKVRILRWSETRVWR